MFERRIPEWVRHAPKTGARTFAIIFGVECMSRSLLASLFPVLLYKAMGDAQGVSSVYFVVGIAGLCMALITPFFMHFIPRRFMYTIAILCLSGSSLLAATGSETAIVAAIIASAISTVVMTICLNAYIMDYVARTELSTSETLRMFYAATAWTVGPFLGVWLADNFGIAVPLGISAFIALLHLATFWYMRLGDGKVIVKAHSVAPNILSNVGKFFKQPRLVIGWSFSAFRSAGWWSIFVYVPIFCIEAGWGSVIGGLFVSIANALLFTTPLYLKWMKKRSVRTAIIAGFSGSAISCLFIMVFWSIEPYVAIIGFCTFSISLVMLDVCGNLPFLMSVKPSQRAEMAAVYSSYRDVAAFAAPGGAALILFVAPTYAVFGMLAGGMSVAVLLGRFLHPRLGAEKTTSVSSS